jgi:hypothetical protein
MGIVFNLVQTGFFFGVVDTRKPSRRVQAQLGERGRNFFLPLSIPFNEVTTG